MYSDSLLIGKLDSLSKHVAQLQHSANTDTGITIEKVAVFLSGVFGAYLVFLWNRNKEYRAKRGEIAGEIHLLIFDFKIALNHQIRHHIYYKANNRICEIISDDEWQYTMTDEEKQVFDPTVYVEGRDNSFKWMNEQRENLFQARRMLSKHFGQYKFYLSKETREEFNTAIKQFYSLKLPEYLFGDLDSIAAVERRIKESIEKVGAVVREIYKTEVDCIDSFLEANID